MSKMKHLQVSILFLLLMLSASDAQISNEISPTTKPSLSPTNAPVFTPSPTTSECANNPNWYFESRDYSASNCPRGKWLKLGCDDDRVGCWDYGNLGSASYNCCKCKESDCSMQCNDPTPTPDDGTCGDDTDDYFTTTTNDDVYTVQEDDQLPIFMGIAFVIFFIMAIALQTCNHVGQLDARLEANRQTMAARRQQQRESNSQGLTEEERNHARYELFVTKFHFQTVLPDKSNITAISLRSLATIPEENAKENNDDASVLGESERPIKRSLTRRLSSWRRPSAKDECCICLECYNVGETICAAITKECDHVFHEGCILQWVKNNDKCPLCRVELLKESEAEA